MYLKAILQVSLSCYLPCASSALEGYIGRQMNGCCMNLMRRNNCYEAQKDAEQDTVGMLWESGNRHYIGYVSAVTSVGWQRRRIENITEWTGLKINEVVQMTEDRHRRQSAFGPPQTTLYWVLSHWAHFTVPRFICVCVFVCVYLVILHMWCIIVTRWGGPGGIEA